MPVVEEIPLKRNGTGYLIDNYVFLKSYQRKGNKKTYLKCYEKSCGALVLTTKEATLTNNVHTHDQPTLDTLRFRTRILEDAKKPSNARTPLAQIYSTARNELLKPFTNRPEREEVGKTLPTYQTIASSMCRSRSDVAPVAPKTRKEIDTNFI